MKRIFTLSLLLTAMLGAGQLAAAEKVKPGKPKPIERTRRHLHREAMQRVHRNKARH